MVKFVFVAPFFENTAARSKTVRAKIGWLGMGIMCPSGTTCLTVPKS